jgi:hypothetical protein
LKETSLTESDATDFELATDTEVEMYTENNVRNGL